MTVAPPPPSRLGFAVLVLGQPGLKSSDTRRWQKSPHLKTSLEYLHGVFDYLEKQRITMYRMSSDIAPYVTHPDMPQFHGQVAESTAELDALGGRAREIGLRLSFHPSQYTILNSPDPELNRKSVLDIESQATILDRMGAGPEAVIIVHVGGVYGDKPSAMDRWVASYHALPEASKRRLVLENDDISYSAANVLEIHGRTGVPCVFDSHHFCCNNPERLDLGETARLFLRDMAGGGAAEDARLLPAHADARTQTPQPENQKTRNRRAAAALDGARRLRRPVRVHRPDAPVSGGRGV